MRFIYTDEAGISAKEPATVVVGIIVHADTQWRTGETLIRKVLATVPEKHRRGFVSHAKSVWSDKKYRTDWSLDARFTFLCEMLSIPRRIGLAVSWAIVCRDAEAPSVPGYRKEQVQHAQAFQLCAAFADRFVREYCAEEIATVVAADAPNVRALLRSAVAILSRRPQMIPADSVLLSDTAGRSDAVPRSLEFKVQRIVDTVHYAAKGQAPFLQVADACAFALRRHFSNQSRGDDLVKAILGGDEPGLRFKGKQAQRTHTCGVILTSQAQS